MTIRHSSVCSDMTLYRLLGVLLLAAAPAAYASTAASHLVWFKFRPEAKCTTVAVAGSFNGWNKDASPMSLQADGRTWQASLPLSPGVYQFKYVLNGTTWVDAPGLPEQSDGNGNVNSVLVVYPAGYSMYPDKIGDGSITPQGIAHHPAAPYVQRVSAGVMALMLRTRANDVAHCTLLQPRHAPITLSAASSNPLYDYWRVQLPVHANQTLHYAFQITDGSKTLALDNSGLHTGRPEQWFSLKVNRFPPFITPQWPRSAVFYQIFPDRFADGDPSNNGIHAHPFGSQPDFFHRQGGDLQGVMQHWQYLQKLGINALYFNPLFTARSYHGYDTTDYLHVDPHFGSNALLKQLVQRAHKSGWHVILDGVFNHTGIDFPAFQSLLKQGTASPYKQWYFVHHFPLHVRSGETGYEGWFGSPYLPKLNVLNPNTQKFLLHVATWWIRYAHIDGWRLDAADQVTPQYWRIFRKTVKKQNPQAYLVGEIWPNAAEWLQGDMFDSVMNYRWRQDVLNFFAYQHTTPTQFAAALQRIESDYPQAADNVLFNILDSHDTERIRTTFQNNWTREQQAVVFQLTYPGTPCIYYGDEIGMEGGRDPDDRRAMLWQRSLWHSNTLHLYQNAIALRRSSKTLQTGGFRTVTASDAEQMYGFERILRNKHILVLFNRSDTARTEQLSAEGAYWKSLLPEGVAPTQAQNKLTLQFPPYGWAVLGN